MIFDLWPLRICWCDVMCQSNKSLSIKNHFNLYLSPHYICCLPLEAHTAASKWKPSSNFLRIQLIVGFSGGDKWWQELDHRFIRGPVLLPTLRHVVARQWSSVCREFCLGPKRCSKKLRNTKGWIDQDSNGCVNSIDKSRKIQFLSNSTRDDMSKLKTKLPRIMYHSLWWMSCKICKCLFCNNFSQGLLMHRGLFTFQWRHLALRNAAKLISEKCTNIFARVRIVCVSCPSSHAIPYDSRVLFHLMGIYDTKPLMVFFTHGNFWQHWGVVLRLLLKSDILGLLKIGLNLATWKAVRCWGTWANHKKHQISFSILSVEFYTKCKILCYTSSGYRILWSEKNKDIIIPTKVGPFDTSNSWSIRWISAPK